MKRHIVGLHGEQRASDDTLEGAFLVRVDRVRQLHPGALAIPPQVNPELGISAENTFI